MTLFVFDDNKLFLDSFNFEHLKINEIIKESSLDNQYTIDDVTTYNNIFVLIDYGMTKGIELNNIFNGWKDIGNITVYFMTADDKLSNDIENSIIELKDTFSFIDSNIIIKPIDETKLLSILFPDTTVEKKFVDMVKARSFPYDHRIINKNGDIFNSKGFPNNLLFKNARMKAFKETQEKQSFEIRMYRLRDGFSTIANIKLDDDYVFQLSIPEVKREYDSEKRIKDDLINLFETIRSVGFTRIRVYKVRYFKNDSFDNITHSTIVKLKGQYYLGKDELKNEFNTLEQSISKGTKDTLRKYENEKKKNKDIETFIFKINNVKDFTSKKDKYWHKHLNMDNEEVPNWLEIPVFNDDGKVISLISCDRLEISALGANDFNIYIKKEEIQEENMLGVLNDIIKKMQNKISNYKKIESYPTLKAVAKNINNDNLHLNTILINLLDECKVFFKEQKNIDIDTGVLRIDYADNKLHPIKNNGIFENLQEGFISNFPLFEYVQKKKDIFIIQDTKEDPSFEELAKNKKNTWLYKNYDKLTSIALFPIKSNGVIVAVVYFHCKKAYTWSNDNVSYITIFLGGVIGGIDNYLQIEYREDYEANIFHEIRSATNLLELGYVYKNDEDIKKAISRFKNLTKNIYMLLSREKENLSEINIEDFFNEFDIEKNFILKGKLKIPEKTMSLLLSVLIDNAFMYSTNKRLLTIGKNDKYIYIDIENDGHINKETKEIMFSQKPMSTKKTGDGLGIGLYYAKRISLRYGYELDLIHNADNKVIFRLSIGEQTA